MNSLQAFPDKKSFSSGFTLVEILITVGLVLFVFAIASVVDVNYYSRELSATEVSVLVSTLQKARSRAMNNVGATKHGVYLTEDDSFVIFRGDFFDPDDDANEYIPRNPNISVEADSDEVYFEQLSGNPSETGDITLTDGTRTKTINLNRLGLISW